MRTQFLYVGLLSMTLAGGLVSAGCDSNHTGQPSDPSGPVKLIRIMVQDDDTSASGGRSVAVDLLDGAGSPLSTAVACNDDLNPCIPEFNFNLGGAVPDFSCVSGFCLDPLQPASPTGPVKIQVADGSPGSVGGTEIRLVFNKLLNADKIETIMPVAGPPGSDESYALNDGVADLKGPDGAIVPSVKIWDGGGSPVNTSDIILNPFGPAIVIKPMAPLLAASNYTIVIHSGMIVDRKGNPMADQNGNVVTGDYTRPFTTEGLTVLSANPDITATGAMPPVAIPTDAAFEFTFNTNIATTPTIAVTGTNLPAGATILGYPATAADPTATPPTCALAGVPNVEDFTLVDATGKALAWPAGDYTLTPSFAFYIANGDGTSTAYPAGTPFMVTVDPTLATGGDPSQATHPLACP
jgi:hypothetical protein